MSNVKHALAQVRNHRGNQSLANQLSQLGFGGVDTLMSRLDLWPQFDNRNAHEAPPARFDWNSAERGALVWH